MVTNFNNANTELKELIWITDKSKIKMPAANNGIKLYLNPRRVHILMVFMKL